MFTLKESLITDYERVLTGEIEAVPSTFFDNCTALQKERYAIYIIEYALTQLLKLSAEQALYVLNKDIVEKLKLNQFIRYIRFPYNLPSNAYFYIVFLCYPSKFMDKEEKTILYIYKKTMTKEMRLPSNFFDGEKGKDITAIAFRYQLDFMAETVDNLYRIFSNEREGKAFLRDLKLANCIGTCFENPLEMLHYSLPDYMKSNLWYNYYKFKVMYKKKKEEYLEERRKKREKKN